MFFSDIHFHCLFSADDGAQTESAMFALVDTAYSEGTRLLCCTPHFHPGYYGDNTRIADEAFAALHDYCRDAHPDLTLLRGNELFYSPEAVSWLASGLCRTMNGTRYVLVDFPADTSGADILSAAKQLLRAGYQPILAHAERYPDLSPAQISDIRSDGAAVQVNASSLLKKMQIARYLRAHAILSEGLADVISSDAHNTGSRPPAMKECHALVSRRYGAGYADALCRSNAEKLLGMHL